METAAGVVVGGVILLVLVGSIVASVFYCLTLYRALARVDASRQKMTPGLVWLNFIPLFNLGWHFYTVTTVADSLAAEFYARSIPDQGRPGFAMGITTSVLFVVSIIPYIGVIAGIAGMITWIIYWVQISNFSAQISRPVVIDPA